MDKNAIKKYAVWARTELIERVTQRAEKYDVSKGADANVDSVHGHLLTADEKKQRQALLQKVNEKGFNQVMEEVAYTWFNRFAALRFMEVNGYLPSHVRVFTDDDNNFKPQILAEAIHLDIDGLDMEKVYAYKDANQTEELYKYLLITQCNALSKLLPGMFQRIADYTELLFPDNLLREGSVVEQMISLIPEDDWKDQIQIVGWLYQYYNSEPKDKVFADLKKNVKITKEKIPAATQLFTPDWIVRYMVENSLGRLWADGHPGTPIKAEWKYYLEEAEQEPDVQKQLAEIRKEYAALKPEEIRVIDPCSGSGHILAYMFDVLVQIYGDYGIPARDAVRSIIENNLWGLDIDERAAQLAYFSVMMKGVQYDRRFLRRTDENGKPDIPQPHIFAIRESNHLDNYAVEQFVNGDAGLKKDMATLIDELHDAKEYGSILNVSQVNFDYLYKRFDECKTEISMYQNVIEQDLYPFVQVAQALAMSYDIVVTNPPYMNSSGMDSTLRDYIKDNYPNTKTDLSTVFMERNLKICNNTGYVAMINIPVWMNLASCEKFRKDLIRNNSLINMLHFGRGVFGSDFGSTGFVMFGEKIHGYTSFFQRLYLKQGAVDSVEQKEDYFFSGIGKYLVDQDRFLDVPGYAYAYQLNKIVFHHFANDKTVGLYGSAKQGLITGSNDTFLRLWHEVDFTHFTDSCATREIASHSGKRWYPYNKGGDFRKWFGNFSYVVDWSSDGYDIQHFYDEKGKLRSRPQNMDYYFREGLTWTALTAGKFSMRYSPQGYLFDAMGPICFFDDKEIEWYVLAFLNSNVGEMFLRILCPNLKFDQKPLENVPLVIRQKDEVISYAKKCVDLSRQDWNSFETSWQFLKNPLVRPVKLISKAFEEWTSECNERFSEIKNCEEQINSIFIQTYELGESMTATVMDEDVTVHKSDLGRDIRSFISYAVGCMLGRYSVDDEGLVFAGGQWDTTEYQSFPVDEDGILPICDDEYFEDDITGLFVKFVETIYGKDTLEDNLKFIADALGGNGSSREVIRNYFLNDFYSDHCSMYSVTGSGKRPIYWLFDSGKKNGFKCLIYMHRYQPDTIARIRTDYVHEQQARYRTAIADLEQRINGASTSERVKLNKQLTKLQGQADEIRVFEEKIHHLADQMISINLDDGVKHNYEIFKDVLAKIK